MKEFISILLGDQSLSFFLAMLFFALLGAFLSLLLQANTRRVHSSKSPIQFSWNFLFSDNARRLLAGLILIFIALRFTTDLFGLEINAFWALAIGFVNDKIAEVLKTKTNLLGNK